jgi:translocator protein
MTVGEGGATVVAPIKKLKWTNLWNIVAFVANAVVTYGVGALGWFGAPTNQELSAKYQTLVTPIGWAFAIWAVIFISQAVWAFLQLLPSYSEAVAETVGFKYVGVCAAQVAWTILFSQELIVPSVGAIATILLFLLSILWSQRKPAAATWTDWLFLQFPFAVHAGWLVAATLVNANVLLVYLKVGQEEQYYGALASLGVVAVAAAIFLLYGQASNYVVGLVLSWATVRLKSSAKVCYAVACR